MEDAAGGVSVVKEEIKGQAFACMALLIGKGATVDEVAEHAANTTAEIFGSHRHKASSLAKEYSRRRKSEFGRWEQLLKEATSEDDGITDQLSRHLEVLPQLDPGNRRE